MLLVMLYSALTFLFLYSYYYYCSLYITIAIFFTCELLLKFIHSFEGFELLAIGVQDFYLIVRLRVSGFKV